MKNFEIKESKLKRIETCLEIEQTNNITLQTMDTDIIIQKLEANLKTRLTTKNMSEVLR